METVTAVYHFEDGSWWVEAPAVPEFVGGADTFDEARVRAREGLEFVLECEVDLDERFDDAAMAARRNSTSLHVSGFGPVEVRVSAGLASFAIEAAEDRSHLRGRASGRGSRGLRHRSQLGR